VVYELGKDENEGISLYLENRVLCGRERRDF